VITLPTAVSSTAHPAVELGHPTTGTSSTIGLPTASPIALPTGGPTAMIVATGVAKASSGTYEGA
jgi:hypothetical protein